MGRALLHRLRWALLLLLLLLLVMLSKVHALLLLLLLVILMLLHRNLSDMLLWMLRHRLLLALKTLGNKGLGSLMRKVPIEATRVAAILRLGVC